MDKRLAWMVVGFGLLVIGGGVMGYVAKGSTASIATAGPIGALLSVFGVFALRGAPWARWASCGGCATVAAVMLSRFLRTGALVPALPVAVLGLGLAIVLLRGGRRAA